MQAVLDPLLPDEAEEGAVEGEGYGGRSFGDIVFGSPLGKGTDRSPRPSMRADSMPWQPGLLNFRRQVFMAHTFMLQYTFKQEGNTVHPY